jgi:hypothetical protein
VSRFLRFLLLGIVLFLILGVWVSREFPALTNGPRSSVELIEGLFEAPRGIRRDAARYLLNRVKREAVVVFINSCDLRADQRKRLVAMVRGEQFQNVTVPFVYYLYELYGSPALAEPRLEDDLAYAEPPPQPARGGPGLLTIVRQSPAVIKHVSTALGLFDAIFLRVKPGATEDQPLLERYDEAAYEEIQAIVRGAAGEMLAKPSDARNEDKNEYAVYLEEMLRDDEKLSHLIEFFTDFIRDLSDSWLESFVRREDRKERRLEWVTQSLHANRYYEIADFARARAERKLVVHITVDGLQGKLLEGLAQLSSGDRDGSGARYVADLVALHKTPLMDPGRYEPRMPPGLGEDVVELAERAPIRPDYLENFKKYFFAPDAPAVIVNAATVDTPAISLRNLPVVTSGHSVAGPFGTGLPNFSYLDRRTGRGWYFWGSDVLYMRNIFSNHEDLIPHGRKRPDEQGARTLFERLWRYNTVSCMATVDTGALEKISSEVGLAVGELRRNFIEKIMVSRFRRRAEMERNLNESRAWLIAHRGLSDGFLASLFGSPVELKKFREQAEFLAEHDDEGLPDYFLWYSPWPDHFAHYKGPYSDEIIGYQGEYDRLDFYIGKMMEVYESVKPVSGAGGSYADRTLFGIVSDHGLVYTPHVVATDELLFASMRRDGIDVRYQKLTQDEGGMPSIHGRRSMKPTRPFDAVVGSTAGGSYIIDLFDPAGLDGDDAMWQRHPDYHQLRRHRLLSGSTIDWIEQIKRHLADTMDIALVREYGPDSGERWPSTSSGFQIDTVVRVFTPDRGEARIYRSRSPRSLPVADKGALGTRRYRYEVLGDRDPLDLPGSVRGYLISAGGPSVDQVRESLRGCIDSPDGCEDARWLDLLSYTVRPDVIHQFSHLYDSDRAGTINVFPVLHVGMNSGLPGRHAGEAFGEKNGTQLYRGAGLRRAVIQTARNGSLPVTLYHWLVGGEVFFGPEPESGIPPAGQFGFRSLLDAPAFAPVDR